MAYLDTDLSRRRLIKWLGLFAIAALMVAAPADPPVRAQDGYVPTVLITGSNRGLGLEFAKQYAAAGWQVIATARKPDKAEDLQALAAQNANVIIEQLDVNDLAMIDALAEKYEGQPIDVLLNNAGLSGSPTPDQVFGELDYDRFDAFMRTNARGPLKMSEAFFEHVKASQQKKIVAVSSLAGSFSNNSSGENMPGGVLYYKASKTALNMFMTELAMALKKFDVTVIMVSPGLVDTQGFFPPGTDIPGLVPIEDSIGGMIDVIDGATVDQAGQFIRYNGEPQSF